MDISIKHNDKKRSHIPSKEEEGTENANPKVKLKDTAELPINPVTHRGQDPELFWLNKYGNDDRQQQLKIDIRSLYRYEHISPEVLIKKLATCKEEKNKQAGLWDNVNEIFGNALNYDELDKVSDYYAHTDGWTNRLIQGDSLLVMTSLLEREAMAGKVQTIYIDPPYGIKYGSNWQVHLQNRDVKDGSDEHLTAEPEQIKAYRDTWELGIHSYLSYLRDRLLTARELLTDSGSCFVQISDENVHLVRNLMDEIFGSENFVSMITFTKTAPLGVNFLPCVSDYILFYAKNIQLLKFKPIFEHKPVGKDTGYQHIVLKDGSMRPLTKEEKEDISLIPEGAELFNTGNLMSTGYTKTCTYDFEFKGRTIQAKKNSWKTNKQGVENLIKKNRLYLGGNTIYYVQKFADFPVKPISNVWEGTRGDMDMRYVVQTSYKVIQRCILMTTDPGDLVLDPTCGSGTTAYVCEQWGRRWITIDTSRIALNIAKTRLMTAVFPYYQLYADNNVTYTQDKNGKLKAQITPKPENEKTRDIAHGFVYEKVPHITLKSLANDEPPETETLYDRPYEDKNRMRVSGPFTVETLQSYEPIAPEAIDATENEPTENSANLQNFEDKIFEMLKSSGVKNGRKDEKAVFSRVERIPDAYLHAQGFYPTERGERKAYMYIGPRFGSVTKQSVNDAVRECRTLGDADWLLLLGFAFDSDIEQKPESIDMGTFRVDRVRMNDDLLQDGLTKKDKKAAIFVTIGEPDIQIHTLKDGSYEVEVLGMDIYDPIRDSLNDRGVTDIAYWMLDDDYDGNNFVVRQVFFCGGDNDEFNKFRKGLDNMAKSGTKKNAEKLLKIEIDEEAFDRLYGYKSHPIKKKGEQQRIAVRVVSMFGEESTKVIKL